MSTFETILYERSGRIIRITMNRPDKRNSLSPQMLKELIAAFESANDEADASCIVLRGAGDKAFCSGADLSSMSAPPPAAESKGSSREEGGGSTAGEGGFLDHHDARGLFPKLFLAIQKNAKVTIAAVNGACLAGGVGLMLACDLAIAKAGVKIGTPEIARGLFPYMISAFILRAMPRRQAYEMMLLGDLMTSEEAEKLHLVNKTVPEGAFEGAVDAWAKKLASYSPAVLKLGRRALVEQEGMPIEGAFSYLQGLLTVNAMLEDAAEGIAAFFEKREPQFKGR